VKLTSFIICLISIMGGISSVQARPPTVDPTYGMKPAKRTSANRKSEPPADWIWASHTSDIQTVLVRKSFTLKKKPQTAYLYVTADNLFTAWINGHLVGSTPISSNDLIWTNNQRFSVSGFLRSGINVIAIQGVNQGGAAGMIAMLKVNGNQILTTNGTWKVLDQPSPPPMWNNTAFDDSSWSKATVIAPYGSGVWGSSLTDWPGDGNKSAYMAHMPIAPRKVTVLIHNGRTTGAESLAGSEQGHATITPNPDSKNAHTVLLFDFGQELAGRLQVWGTKGAQLSITTGESLQECDHAEPALDNHGPFALTLAGTDPASTPYTAFRFAKLQYSGSKPIDLNRVRFDFKYYPVQYKGSFNCSDPLLTRIWYTGAYTAHLCMQEDIWDAPKRDRGLWIGDLQVTGQTINVVFADKFLMERSIELVREQAQGGHPSRDLPVSEVNSIPGYSAAWFCTLADYYMHHGDKAILRRQHANIISLLKYLKTDFDSQSLFNNPHNAWDFCDWAPGFIVDSPLARAATDLYIIMGVQKAVYLLQQIGDKKNAHIYSAWEHQLTVAARTHLYETSIGAYGNRLQENVMAILSGAATKTQAAGIYDRYIKPGSPIWVAPQGASLSDSEVMSPYYGYFVLSAMGKLHQNQDAVNLLRRYWGDMLARGAVTWWEVFDPSWPHDFAKLIDKMSYMSLSHGWSSGPTSYLTEYILGVRPGEPGYASVIIQPKLCDLKWVEGDVPTPKGIIHVRAFYKNGRMAVNVKLPPHIHAQIIAPGAIVRIEQQGRTHIQK
jgi:hypothetical protein